MTYLYLLFSFVAGVLICSIVFYLYKKRKYDTIFLKQVENILNAISEPIAFFDGEGKLIRYNKPMLDFLNVAPKDIKEKKCYEIVHHTNTHIENCPLLRAKKSLQREEMVLEIKNRSFIVSVYPLFNKKGNATEFIHLMKDVTEFDIIQHQLQETTMRLKLVIDHLPGFVYNCDNDRNWTMHYISDGCFDITGYKPDDFIDNKIIAYNDIIAPEYRDDIWNKWQEILKNKEDFESEYEIITASGERRWVWEHGCGIFDNNNQLQYLEGFIINIDDRKKIMQALEENEEKFRALTNSTTASIFIYNKEKFIFANPASEVLTGFSLDELLQMNFWDVVHPDFKEMVKSRGLSRLKGINEPINYDFKILRKNNESRWIKFSAGYLSNYKGEVASIGTAIDITDLVESQNKLQELVSQLEESEKYLKMQNEEYLSLNEELKENNQKIQKLNEELVVAKEKAESSDRLKTSFLNNISHEIRTPLNAILGFSELLKKKNLPEEKISQYLGIIIASGNQLLNIITNIINVATIEAGEEKIYYKKINLNLLVEQCLQTVKPLIANKKIEVSCTHKLPDDKTVILTDETKLQQILINLLTNAIKFTETGHVHIAYMQKGTNLEFSVEDTGVGISKEFLPYIFERFVQEKNPLKKNIHSGMGLGLSLSKSYIKLLGGNIEVKSSVGNGSTFSFYIPYLPIHEEIINFHHEKFFQFSKTKKILLVEDTDTNADLIKEYLLPYPFQLIHITNGLEALNYIKQNNDVDLILMDIKMPELDGYQTCMEIIRLNANIPIIGVTAYNHEEDAKKMKDCGMKAFLTKPIERITFLREIEKWINK